MRLLVLFDLPVASKAERRVASRFRKYLQNDGYYMLQFSIYCRVCKGIEAVDKHITRLQPELPPEGNVRMMVVTEKQFQDMQILVGKPEKNEEHSCEQLVLL